MIKQTHLIFELDDLQVYIHTMVGPENPPLFSASHSFGVHQEVWWRDNHHPQGHGPFQTVYGAMKHYSGYRYRVVYSGSEVISVDFKNRRRVRET